MNMEEMGRAVELFAEELAVNLDANLESVLVYGSFVKDDHDPVGSDLNVAIVLNESGAAVLRQVAATVRARRPSDKTELFVVTVEEVENARDVFPIKFRDISRHHKAVLGKDVFEGLEFDREHLVIDCENQLRSLLISLRRLFISGSNRKELMRQSLVGSFKGFLPPMAALLELATDRHPVKRTEILEAAGEYLETDVEALHQLNRLARDPEFVPGGSETNDILDGYIRVLKVAAWKADKVLAADQEASTGKEA